MASVGLIQEGGAGGGLPTSCTLARWEPRGSLCFSCELLPTLHPEEHTVPRAQGFTQTQGSKPQLSQKGTAGLSRELRPTSWEASLKERGPRVTKSNA